MAVAAVDQDRPTRFGLVTGFTFVGALAIALVVRGSAVVGIAALFLLFVPLEKVFALRPQKVFRRGLLTDLTHLLVNNLFSTALGIGLVVVALIPVFWLRNMNIVGLLPPGLAVALAAVLVFVGNYWGHRLTHTVLFLWRFHAVHDSIATLSWGAAARLPPSD